MSAIEMNGRVPATLDRTPLSYTIEKPRDARARSGGLLHALRHLDGTMLLCLVTLTAYGLWMLAGTVNGAGDWRTGLPDRQLTWFGISLCGLAFALLLDYRWLGKLAAALYFGNLGLLVAVLFVGTTVNHSTSWLRLGPLSFQPAETMKVVTVMMVAQWFAQRPEGVRRLRDLFVPAVLCVVPAVLILRQPDFGTAMLFAGIFAAMVYWAGIRRWILVGMILLAVAGAAATYPLLKPYQKDRLKVFLDPSRDPQGRGYNVIQSLIAVGSGGLTGRGWGQGTQAVHRWLPEAHTDFIFASSVEQTGLVGAMTILGLFGVLFWRILRAVRVARDRFGGLLVVGLGSILLGHVVINVSMNVGLFPVTGLPLPFFSYGGSFLLATYVLVGLILNVSMRRFVANPG